MVALSTPVLAGGAVAVLVLAAVARAVEYVPDGERRVLTVRGEFRGVLGPGLHVVPPLGSTARAVDVTSQRLTARVRGVPTADRVPVDVEVDVEFRVTDPRAAVEAVEDPARRFLEDVEIATKDAVRAEPVHDLQDDPDGLAADVRTRLQREVGAYGLTVEAASVASLTPTEG